jgi:osmotically-inducible protein OsmY
MPQDVELEDSVKAALARDSRLQHDEAIAVFARAGVVTLRGTVESFKQRRAAVEDAHVVTGVEAVYDELDLRPLPHDPHDDEIRGAALQALISDDRVPETEVDVAVTDRWVTLKGEVRYQQESDAAFEDVAKLDGVGGISNAIKVVTAPRMA